MGYTPYPTVAPCDALCSGRLRESPVQSADRQNGSPQVALTGLAPLYLLDCRRKYAVLSTLSAAVVRNKGFVAMARALQSCSIVGVGRQNWPKD